MLEIIFTFIKLIKTKLFYEKIYSSVGIVAMILFSNSAFSQKKISADQVQPILEKLNTLGKLNPAGAIPVDKLSK